VVAALLAAGAWALWGWSAWSALFAVLMLGCWIMFVYSWFLATRALAALDETPVITRGMTMNWAAPVYDWYCPKLGLGKVFRNETLRHAALQPGVRMKRELPMTTQHETHRNVGFQLRSICWKCYSVGV